MKISLNKILTAAPFIFSIAITGCLKDKEYDSGAIQSVRASGDATKVVEIKLTASNTTNFFAASYSLSTTDTIVDLIPVNLATKEPAATDLHVTLAIEQSLVDNYNTANATDYGDPVGKYTLVNNGVVTIPKGSHTGFLQLKFVPEDFLGANWAIGFVISSIAENGYTISGNLSTGITAIIIKNKYEGNYTTSGTRTRYFGGTEASGVRDMFDIVGVNYFTTADANTITGQLADAGSGGTMSLTVDATDGTTVIITNPVGGAYPTLANTVGKTSTYDPATKTFHIYASYLNSTGALRTVDETLVKVP